VFLFGSRIFNLFINKYFELLSILDVTRKRFYLNCSVVGAGLLASRTKKGVVDVQVIQNEERT
jgi:hypothetical protein